MSFALMASTSDHSSHTAHAPPVERSRDARHRHHHRPFSPHPRRPRLRRRRARAPRAAGLGRGPRRHAARGRVRGPPRRRDRVLDRRGDRRPLPPHRRRRRAPGAPRGRRALTPLAPLDRPSPQRHPPPAPGRPCRPSQDRVSEGTVTPPATRPAGAASPRAPAGGRSPAPGWQIWTALWIVYIVWGSTYLAIRILVETIPPLLGAGARFGLAGAVMVAVLAVKRGVAVRPTRAQLAGAGIVGLLLPGANAVVSVAEQEVPSSIAALLIASVPLWVILLRAGTGDRVSARGAASVLVGFAGVALLVRPGDQSGDATMLGLLACVGAALMWASGSFASPRLSLPRDPLASVGWQMLLGGIAITLVALAVGEGAEVDVDAFSTRSLLALA